MDEVVEKFWMKVTVKHVGGIKIEGVPDRDVVIVMIDPYGKFRLLMLPHGDNISTTPLPAGGGKWTVKIFDAKDFFARCGKIEEIADAEEIEIELKPKQ